MKKKMYWKKAAAVTTAVVMGCAMTGCGSESSAKEATTSKSEKKANQESEALLETMNEVTGLDNKNTDGVNKEETVYVMADASGTPSEIIVSEWLKNTENAKTLTDTTNLTDIENIKGDETYTTTKDGIEWSADGNDIYYQGKSQKELPVSVKVSYYLGDQKIEPKQLAGKSGRVKIRYEYVNNSMVNASTGDTDAEVYTPFVMATGMLLPTDTFSNVTVSNGNVISEGNNIIAVGIGIPGLSKSMGLDELEDLDLDFELPDYFEVTADVKNFNLGMSITLCSNSLIDMGELFSENSMDGIADSVNTLIDGANQLEDGSIQLADGTNTLREKLGEFAVGVKDLQSGIKTYTDGVKSVHDGSGQLTAGADQVDEGAQKLQEGAESLVKGADEANSGAGQVAVGANNALAGAGLLVQGYEGTQQKVGAVDGAKQVADGLAQLNEAVQNLNLPDMSDQSSKLTDEQKAAVELQVSQFLSSEAGQEILNAKTTEFIEGVKAAMNQYGVALDTQTEYVLTQVLDGAFRQAFSQIYISAYESGMEMGMEQVLAQVSQQLQGYAPQIATLKDSVNELAAGAASVSGGVSQLYSGTVSLRDGLKELAAGAGKLSAGTGKLYDGSKELNSGIEALKQGTATLKTGTFTLYKGVTTLHSSSSQLTQGAGKLTDATTQVQEGVNSLNSGAIELKDGMVKFNEEGIDKISAIMDEDLKHISDRLEAISTANEDYELYGGILDGDKGVEKFIIKIDGIEK